jgi:hypothetical protein
LAPGWILILLALEIEAARRETEGAAGDPSADPEHEPGQPALGCTPHRRTDFRKTSSRRTASPIRSDLIYDKDRVPDHEFICSWYFMECQLKYFGLVRELVEEVDTGDVDVLYRSWCRPLEFANEPAIWSTIELVAETLEHQRLSFERGEQSDQHFELELEVPARHCCAWLQHRDNSLEIF